MEEGTGGTRRKRGVERRCGLTVRIQLENGGAARPHTQMGPSPTVLVLVVSL